jgi:hypothetical protein
MKTKILIAVCVFFSPIAMCFAQSSSADIDWSRAKELYQRAQRGDTLNKEDRLYLDRATEFRRGQQRQNAPSSHEQRMPPARLLPLTDFGADDQYEGQDGGLYGGGKNIPSEKHAQAARAELKQIQPLNAEGKPAAHGTIVFISISMSNATQEFSRFKQLADASGQKSKHVRVVDCAQGGQAMAAWAPADAKPWQEALRRLERARVSPEQVQVAWVKLANKRPTGSMKEHVDILEADTIKVLHNARTRFPNLRIVYLGSRIWAGEGKGNLNPEPYAYESAFAVRNLIQQQIADDARLARETSPLLLWGPYLWSEGERGRKIDDLTWKREDFANDGIHPSMSGRTKVAQQLLDFCTSNPLAKTWFVGPVAEE